MMAVRLGHNTYPVQPGKAPARFGEQLGQVRVRPATAAASAEDNSSVASERSTAVHEGSMPTIGTDPASAVTVRPRILRAASSWPVDIQVSPQHC
jgi:hypothetical protein